MMQKELSIQEDSAKSGELKIGSRTADGYRLKEGWGVIFCDSPQKL